MTRTNAAARTDLVTQKARIRSDKGERVVYLQVHKSESPQHIMVRVKGTGTDEEKMALYDLISRLMSRLLQRGEPLESIGEMLHGYKYAPAGPIQCDERIKNCTSVADYVGRHVLVEFCGRDELAHVHTNKEGGQ